jgi:predicted N-acetyltransferase YhbS
MALVIGPRFTVRGIEPAAVRTAPAGQRRAFWLAASQFIAEAKESELKAGLDKDGNPLAALAKYTIEHRESEMGPADPFAPPLQPAHGLSRTRSLFMAQPTTRLDGVTCWWGYDAVTGESWGKMLAIHRAGGPKLPPRDVIGLSKQSVNQVKAKAAAWWKSYVKSKGAEPVPSFAPELEPTPAPKFKVERVPKYEPKYPERAIPKKPKRVSQIKINGHIYTLQSGSAEMIRRGIADKSFSGFGRVTPLPGGPDPFAAKAVSGSHYAAPSETAAAIRPKVQAVGRVADLRAKLKTVAPKLRVNELADLVGASGEAKVTAGITAGGKVYARATARDYSASISIQSKTTLRITALDVPIDRQGKGIGREVVTGMIDKAKSAGFRRVTLEASRAPGDIGYMVWPKFGFDGPLPAAIRGRLPEAFRGARTLGELLKMPGGRAWWQEHGVTIELSLEL